MLAQTMGLSLLDKGIALYEAKKYPLAARHLQDFLATQPPAIQQAEGLCYLAEVHYALGDNTAAYLSFKHADTLARQNSLQIDTLDFYYRILQGVAASCREYNEKRQYYQALLDFANQKDQATAEEKAAAFYGMAIISIQEENYAQAVNWLKKSIQTRLAIGLDADLAEEYFTYAYLHYINEDYYQAVINQQLGLSLLSKNDKPAYFDHLTNLAAYYFDNRDLSEARKYLQEAIQFGQKNIAPSSPLWGFLYGIEQEIFNERGLLDSLASSLQTAATYYQQYPTNKTESFYHYHLNQAAALSYLQKDYAQAQKLIDQFLNIFGEAYPKSFQSMQFLQSKVHIANKQFDTALLLIQQLITAYAQDNVSESAQDDPNYLFSANELKPSALAITYLKDKAAYYTAWHTDSKQEEHLLKSNQCIQLADELISEAKSQNNQLGFRSQLDEISAELRKVEIENYFRLFQKDQRQDHLMAALNSSEQVKYLSMTDKLRQNILSDELGLPQELIVEKRKLDSLLYTYYRKVSWQGLGEAELESTKKSIDSLFRRSKTLDLEIQTIYPNYGALLYAPPKLALKDIRNRLLGTNEVLLHFLEIEQSIYVIGISSKELLFKKIQLDEPLAEDCRQLAQEMQQLSPDVFPRLHFFYEQLLAPFQEFLGQRSVLIVPDGHLWYIPFPALLTSLPDLKAPSTTYTYLIKERNIRHLFSLSVGLLQQELKKRSTLFPPKQFTMLGISPVENRSLGKFTQLTNPKTNEKAIQKLLAPEQLIYFSDQKATLTAFRRYASKADLLHIFTHAVVSDASLDSTFLIFQADSLGQNDYLGLSTTEVLNSRLGAQLAVLAACRTAGGELKRGLGVINLAHAFAHAGCENLVVTLWNANDLAVDEILASFYEQILTNNKQQAAALNQAQREYLKAASLGGHPAYWASIIYIGEDSPFRKKQTALPLWLVGSAIGLASLIFWGRIRRKKQSSK